MNTNRILLKTTKLLTLNIMVSVTVVALFHLFFYLTA